MKTKKIFSGILVVLLLSVNSIPVAALDKNLNIETMNNSMEVPDEENMLINEIEENVNFAQDKETIQDEEVKTEDIIMENEVNSEDDVVIEKEETTPQEGISIEDDIKVDEVVNDEIIEDEELLIDEIILEEDEVINLQDTISYSTYIQNHGWSSPTRTGDDSGYPGEGLRMEGLIIDAAEELGLTFGAHIQNIGWQESKRPGEIAGTMGESKRIEALWIDINDETKVNYDILYRVYVEDYGWTNWASNGSKTGSEGLAKRVEAITILLVLKEETKNYTVENLLLKEKKINYVGHVQNIGWQSNSTDMNIVGTVGQGLRLEALDFKNNDDLMIIHEAHLANIGWTNEKTNDDICGTVGQSRAMEAIKLRLGGENKNKFDLYYRVYVDRVGWMSWTKNGTMAGTSGLALRIEAIEIKVFPKGMNMISTNNESSYRIGEDISVNYESYVQNDGWMGKVFDGTISGTTGKSKPLEAFTMSLESGSRVNISYSSYIEGSGWQNFVNEPDVAGTIGKGNRLEAIKVKLDGDLADLYHIYYRLHVSQMGWLDWSMDGNPNGTKGYGYQVEAMEVIVLPKIKSFTGIVKNPYPVKVPDKQEPITTEQKKTTNNLNMRSGPGTNYNTVLVIPKGSIVQVIGSQGNWYNIIYNGTKGWASSDYLTEVKAVYKTIHVPYHSQLTPVYAPVGCEATSLLMALQYKGIATNISYRKFLDDMPKHSSNPAKGFVGSPYEEDLSKRTTIYPQPLTDYANTYAAGRTVNFSGKSVDDIKKEILADNPVVVYLTVNREAPVYVTYIVEGEKQSLLRNNHAVLVTGYDSQTNKLRITDPWSRDGRREYWLDIPSFAYSYNLRNHAIVVR